MILQLLAGLAVAGGLYEWSKEDKIAVQGHKAIDQATGNVITSVVPVVANATNAINNAANAASNLSSTPLNLPPIVISPTGASNVTVVSVKDAQNALNTLGYGPLKSDNILGPLTKAALARYQSIRGINSNGALDSMTKQSLSGDLLNLASPNKAIGQAAQVVNATAQSIAQSPIGSVRDIQTALNALGATPPLSITGKLDPITSAGIKAFQLIHGMPMDGSVSPQVLTAIQMALSGMGMHGEHNNYHPDRPHYWDIPPQAKDYGYGYGNYEDNGVHFSDVKQRLLRDDGDPVSFSCDTDFNY